MMVAFAVIHLVASEYISSQPSKGEVLVFRKSKSPIQSDAFKGGIPLGSMDNAPGAEPALPRQVGVFHWAGLSYEIESKDGPKPILRYLHGWVQPGTLTALMVRLI